MLPFNRLVSHYQHQGLSVKWTGGPVGKTRCSVFTEEFCSPEESKMQKIRINQNYLSLNTSSKPEP